MGFAHHDLCAPNAVEEMQHALDDLGLSGYKWFGPMTTLPFESPELKPFWRLLADRKVPVLIHFGVLGGPGGIIRHPRISPITLAEVAQEYTDIPFIIPHFGQDTIKTFYTWLGRVPMSILIRLDQTIGFAGCPIRYP